MFVAGTLEGLAEVLLLVVSAILDDFIRKNLVDLSKQKNTSRLAYI